MVDTVSTFAEIPGKSGETKLTIYFEDMHRDLRGTLAEVFAMVSRVHAGYVTTAARALACAVANKDTYTVRTTRMDVNRLFDADLTAKICAIVRPIWNSEKWGNRCVYPLDVKKTDG